MNSILRTSRHLWKQTSGKQSPLLRLISTCTTNRAKEGNQGNQTQDAGQFLTTVLGECKTGCVFAGTGQYHEKKDSDRVIMLQFEDDFLANTPITFFYTNQLLDCCMSDSDIDLFMANVKSNATLPVYNGELDIVNQSTWGYGFTLKPFSIFTGDERILLVQNELVYISTEGNTDVIGIDDISHVGLWVSEEPYNERKLMIGLKNDTKRTLIDIALDLKQCDLAQLTVETEWLMKTAALLCINISRQGNKEAHLRVSPVLQPVNNQWVAMRVKNWTQMIQKNTWEKDF